MIGAEIKLDDNKTFQLRDDVQVMCLKQFIPKGGDKPDDWYKHPIVYGLDGSYILAPIQEVAVPSNGVGFEIYNENGKIMFSSLAKFVSFGGKFDVNRNTAPNGQYQINGRKGNRYGYIVFRELNYIHYRNVKAYIDPITYDEVWYGDIYFEGYQVKNDMDGLRFEYIYEFLAPFDGYVDKPPDREGSGMEISGVMVDISMFS